MEELHHQLAEIDRKLKRGDMPCKWRSRLEQRRLELIRQLTEWPNCSEAAVVLATRPGVLP